MPLFAGVGGGIALNKCATRFNQLERVQKNLDKAAATDV